MLINGVWAFGFFWGGGKLEGCAASGNNGMYLEQQLTDSQNHRLTEVSGV